jgi:hypothetical protein
MPRARRLALLVVLLGRGAKNNIPLIAFSFPKFSHTNPAFIRRRMADKRVGAHIFSFSLFPLLSSFIVLVGW